MRQPGYGEKDLELESSLTVTSSTEENEAIARGLCMLANILFDVLEELREQRLTKDRTTDALGEMLGIMGKKP